MKEKKRKKKKQQQHQKQKKKKKRGMKYKKKNRRKTQRKQGKKKKLKIADSIHTSRSEGGRNAPRRRPKNHHKAITAMVVRSGRASSEV